MEKPNVLDVQKFWNENPLFTGEGNLDDLNEFFLTHDLAYKKDVFGGMDPELKFYLPNPNDCTLDIGCGIGFWLSLFKKRGVHDLTGIDLSETSISLAKKREPSAKFVLANCEDLPFEDGSFDFVNCQGVVHHTPQTQRAIVEIYRVMRVGGRGSVSVYFKNYAVRSFPIFAGFFRAFFRIFGKDLGRGRSFFKARSADELVRMYDGDKNPIGKSYSKAEFEKILRDAGFKNIQIDYFFFPLRFFKLPILERLRPLLVKILPFMIVANLKK